MRSKPMASVITCVSVKVPQSIENLKAIGHLAPKSKGNRIVYRYSSLFRASTLTFGGILQIGCKRWFEENFMFEPFDRKVQHIKNSKPIQVTCMMICCSLMIFVVVVGFMPAM